MVEINYGNYIKILLKLKYGIKKRNSKRNY